MKKKIEEEKSDAGVGFKGREARWLTVRLRRDGEEERMGEERWGESGEGNGDGEGRGGKSSPRAG